MDVIKELDVVKDINIIEKDLNIDLINELGQVVKSSKILQGSTLSIVDISTVYNGIYFIKIYNENSSITKSIIIKK